MKYLGIHKLLWFLIVVAWTLFEGIFILGMCIFYIVWTFKFPTANIWMEFHKANGPSDNHWGGYSYRDKNIFETIIRRYKRTWN